ncbi:MaoC/PaaZ C-terminal domain-containing protein [Actinoplanes sp. NEAU-A12]|uniref:MaoC/PaaZ C-terminal domain-containing protein n=1 Tax=Actinoplanes sandaracinus TaxID=3045177 RepID=A0ABT6WFR6_9ACTN|nr:MaoC/PaaZ C-terminal domain-containing protein [Actinoplanes sandaracinus]MDI6098580.1 MaoC/PaaZ C-terminal domain-containing protein [Actinoplanes sandaracinus]
MTDILEPQTFRVTRADLVRYAGASGDFNPIHWSDRVATGVGLPGVIAHGMFTMALVGRAVTVWAGAADAVIEFGVRFSRPVPVPDTDEGTEVVVSATIKEVTGEGHTRLSLTATCNGDKVLSMAQALVRKR